MFYTITKMSVATIFFGVSACATVDPGAFTKEAKPVNVAGHEVRTVFSAVWLETCLGQPEDVAISVSQLEHVPGDRKLTPIATGTVLAPGDCDKYLELLGTLGGAAILADGVRDGASQTINNAIANQVTEVDVDIN